MRSIGFSVPAPIIRLPPSKGYTLFYTVLLELLGMGVTDNETELEIFVHMYSRSYCSNINSARGVQYHICCFLTNDINRCHDKNARDFWEDTSINDA